MLALAALVASDMVTLARAEVPARLSLTYEVWSSGFNSLGLEANLVRSATTYRVNLAVESKGVVGWLFPFKLMLRSSGVVEGTILKPWRFQSAAVEPGKTRRREILYGNNGILELKTDGRPDAEARKRVPDHLTRDSLDPASAIYSVIEFLARGRRCAGDFPVFDGKRRYDLRLEEMGRRTLGPSGYAMYSGAATLCRVAIDRRAGFPERGRKVNRFPSRVDVWLAAVGDGIPPLPVRIESRNDIGVHVGHLVGLRVDGAAHQVLR